MYGIPNSLGYCRFGLSTPRRVGNAVHRNRIRRLLRESFRRMQHELPVGYDLVAVARPHEPLTLNEYDELLDALIRRLDQSWKRKTKPRVLGDGLP